MTAKDYNIGDQEYSNAIDARIEHARTQSHDYSHIFRRKTWLQLIRLSAAVMGIEFAYAAETAFVSPILLEIGLSHERMSLVWMLSPLLGFFLAPLMGSMSDRCYSRLGRRRPLILILAAGMLTGLLLVPNGREIGWLFGDPPSRHHGNYTISSNGTNQTTSISENVTLNGTSADNTSFNGTSADNSFFNGTSADNSTLPMEAPSTPVELNLPWAIAVTVIGTLMLDFSADTCQSPARAYLLDVCVPEQHAKGLSMFTVMAGMGGFFGYGLGGIDWNNISIGAFLGGNVRTVFVIVTVIFVLTMTWTLTSFREVPLAAMEADPMLMPANRGKMSRDKAHAVELQNLVATRTRDVNNGARADVKVTNLDDSVPEEDHVSLTEYLKSIVFMPFSLRILCLCNLFCWMSHVCYSLYFTDFVGEAVFHGDPKAEMGSTASKSYDEGVRFGCFGMAVYSLSCAAYSFVINKLIKRFKAKAVYVGGSVLYAVGMGVLAYVKSPTAVILCSATAGVMYATLFTMPYLLIAHYHTKGTFKVSSDGTHAAPKHVRGLGTDVAIVGGMVFTAQLLLCSVMGAIVKACGTTAVIVSAAVLSACGGLTALKVTYLDL